ncbi:hypothetical protein AL544_016620 [Vibrio mimicus]|uniref:Uncharacterized protein n=1 Tax=Vibrio mimicus TaxID=674 RepID=A0A1D8SDF1_VIBMI|nr:hypothetical protein VM_11850 [Vibrio mimicus]PNM57551.1 hypothetical protein AL544_016620 [Vibrio mimicus]
MLSKLNLRLNSKQFRLQNSIIYYISSKIQRFLLSASFIVFMNNIFIQVIERERDMHPLYFLDCEWFLVLCVRENKKFSHLKKWLNINTTQIREP